MKKIASDVISRGVEGSPDSLHNRFRPDVEGLRAVAVTIVVLYHASVPGISSGYVGVDVFFVVSGFVITRLLLRELVETGSISVRKFYARRAKRILPAATVVTIVTVILTYQFLGVFAGLQASAAARWSAVFAANLHFASGGEPYLASQEPPSPLQHMWSLGVEEQFYLVWPLALLLITKMMGSNKRNRWGCGVFLVIAILLSLSYSIYATPINSTIAFYSPLTRAFELGLGALIAVLTPWLPRVGGRVAGWFGLAGLSGVLASAFLFDEHTNWPGSVVLVPTVATALVLVAGGMREGASAELVLGRAPLRWLGSRSYSLYLWHWPIIIIAAQRAAQPVLPLGQSTILVALSLIMAALSYRILEDPIRTSSKLARRPELAIALGGALISVALASAWLVEFLYTH